MYFFEKAGIPVLPVHLMKAEILASKCKIMQFSFEYILKEKRNATDKNINFGCLNDGFVNLF